jgi:hypothetical protein
MRAATRDRAEQRVLMARRGGPALYELLGTRRDSSGQSGPRGGGGGPRPILDPGQRQLLVLVAVGVVALVAGYLFGVSRGERIGRERLAAERAEEARLLESARPRGATSDAGGAGGSIDQSAAMSGNQSGLASGAGQGPEGSNAGMGTAGSAAGPLPPAQEGVDPREAGKNYFVIMNTRSAAASQVVAFCRRNGLDAWAVGDQNAPFRDIIVLPGFAYEDRRSPTVVELEASIKRVGLLWKTESRSDKGFEGAYPRLFKGN